MRQGKLSTIDEVIESLRARNGDAQTRGLLAMLCAVRDNRCGLAMGCVGCQAACDNALEERPVATASRR
jgi:hypothetical protein